jgi:hypothetical protein
MRTGKAFFRLRNVEKETEDAYVWTPTNRNDRVSVGSISNIYNSKLLES